MDPDKTKQRVAAYGFGSIYQLYIEKAERKDRTKAEVDAVICWLTGYSQKELDVIAKNEVTLGDFVAGAPKLNPNRKLITGVICGVRVEDMTDPFMQTVRYMDKLFDELAKGRPMEKILRQTQ